MDRQTFLRLGGTAALAFALGCSTRESPVAPTTPKKVEELRKGLEKKLKR